MKTLLPNRIGQWHGFLLVAVMLSVLLPVRDVQAQGNTYAGGTGQEIICNTSEAFQNMGGGARPRIFDEFGVISTVANEIKALFDESWELLYTSLITSGFKEIAVALMVLYVVIFGVLFTLGTVQMPLHDAVKRVVKISVVALMVSSTEFFQDTIYRFFREGMGQLLGQMVDKVSNLLTGGGPESTCAAGEGIFAPMDRLVCDMLRPETLMIIDAALNTPPYGIAYVVTSVLGSLFVIGAIARAIWVYLISIMATSFLFGMAPVFISFIMFERTKRMFDAWINMISNFTLQPLIMFTFISFFILLMHQSLSDGMLEAEVCYGPGTLMGLETSGVQATEIPVLQFTDGEGNTFLYRNDPDGPKCLQNGEWTPCEVEFPLNLMALLTFVVLGYVAYSFYDNVIDIARDVTSSFAGLETGSPVKGLMDEVGNKVNDGVKAAVTGGNIAQAMGLAPGGIRDSAPPTTQRIGGPQE